VARSTVPGRRRPHCATTPPWPGAQTTWRRGFRLGSTGQISFGPLYHHSGFSDPLQPVIANESLQSIQSFQWGLVPFWTKDEVAAERIRTRTLNAKAETIHQKPSFRVSIMTKRCLVLVDGFYEWREEGRKKYPYYISLVSNDAFALAGIWDRWLNNRTGEMKDTFSIITTRANPLLKDLQPPIIQRY
jgi:putative SOS response-associated peptidase YedK